MGVLGVLAEHRPSGIRRAGAGAFERVQLAVVGAEVNNPVVPDHGGGLDRGTGLERPVDLTAAPVQCVEGLVPRADVNGAIIANRRGGENRVPGREFPDRRAVGPLHGVDRVIPRAEVNGAVPPDGGGGVDIAARIESPFFPTKNEDGTA